MADDPRVQLTGVKESIAIIRQFDRDLYLKLNRQIRKALQDTQKAAQGKYPKGAWVVGVTRKNLLGYVSARAGGKTGPNDWEPAGVRAAVFEFMGSSGTGKTPQAKATIASLNARYGSPGRFLWSAWDMVGEGAVAEIEQAVENAQQELNTKLGRTVV